MGKTWWEQALFWGIWFACMSLVMGWAARRRLQSRSPSARNQLVHPISTLILGWCGVLLFSAFATLSAIYPDKQLGWKATAILAGFALFSGLLLVEYYWVRHQWTDDGIHYRGLFGRRGFIAWSDLRRVTYSPAAKWFRLESHSGAVARISVMVMGLPEFAQIVLAKSPPEAIDPNSVPVLEATAAGNPPSVWQ